MQSDTRPATDDTSRSPARGPLYCFACGYAYAPQARFCARCGQPVSTSPSGHGLPMHTPPPAAQAPAVLTSRPFWPWVLVLGGLIVAAIFGLQAFTAYQVMQRVEASSAVTVAKGLDLLARLFPPVGAVGQLVDPRNQELYAQAREQLVQGVGVGGLGLLIALMGLLGAALWHPTFLPPGVAASRNSVGAMASVVLLIVAGVYLLNVVDANVGRLSSAAVGLGPATPLQAQPLPPPAPAGRSSGGFR